VKPQIRSLRSLPSSQQRAAPRRPVQARDFDVRPLLVIWEMTQACDLRCVHCRASAQPLRHPLELSTYQAYRLIDEVADMHVPLFVLTGGDPIKRPDLLPMVAHAGARGVRTSLTPSGLDDIYRNSPMFMALRDSSKLKGKCGRCEFRDLCGGSRARACAFAGDPCAAEPCCARFRRA
jgi:MoaA/NifB/PqqE/SkfB family radical SAM enzyme